MKTMLFNPYTGTPRHPSDIASDPEGILLLDPDEPVKAAPTGKDSLAVEPDERVEFEAWINRGERSPLTVKDDRGGYLDTPTHFRWTGWQARASKGTK